MRIRFVKTICIIFILCLLTSNISFAAESQTENENYSDIDYLKSVMDMIRDRYKGNVTEEQLIESAINGMFSAMDQYTEFFDKKEADSFFSDIEGSYVGIGVRISSQTNDICVVEVFESSSAAKAGIIKGDIIVKINDVNVEGKTSEEVANLIRGKAGTKVNLGIMRPGQKQLLNIEVERSEVKINPVTYRIIDDIGYIKLDIFNSNSSINIIKALKEMDNNNISKLILDLRDNPGGELSQVIKIAEKFVPEGLITKLDFQSEKMEDELYYSKNKELKYKLVVLVNGLSASASEILAGAIQDTGAGVLVGTKTYGKGKVQNIYPVLSPEAYKRYSKELGATILDAYDLINNYDIIPSEDEIIGWAKITTGEYYTPKGRMIDGIGLDPDYYVENTYIVNGVDIRTIDTLSKQVRINVNDKSIDVLNAEKILKLLGYNIAKPDMIFDKESAAAVYEFQKDNGFYPYGVLDFATQQALNDKLENLILECDKQMAKALELLKK
ncbi:S41 family peptidase [Acetivibrio clariflavus]|uniref:C-terminal processing peptidase n=1 Tax=Acetivibrio clariflavus (strain DSM 19732 / NBRC 101661 / EBR45) TaxID=720554 RepID=G8LTZ3_ACECE|nr:S41 family peptidase [Acetivibrio clariflavus]AEV67339.1 C-terminal processing peptidase [Acetivibrio clariflavus DSM 19732]